MLFPFFRKGHGGGNPNCKATYTRGWAVPREGESIGEMRRRRGLLEATVARSEIRGKLIEMPLWTASATANILWRELAPSIRQAESGQGEGCRRGQGDHSHSLLQLRACLPKSTHYVTSPPRQARAQLPAHSAVTSTVTSSQAYTFPLPKHCSTPIPAIVPPCGSSDTAGVIDSDRLDRVYSVPTTIIESYIYQAQNKETFPSHGGRNTTGPQAGRYQPLQDGYQGCATVDSKAYRRILVYVILQWHHKHIADCWQASIGWSTRSSRGTSTAPMQIFSITQQT